MIDWNWLDDWGRFQDALTKPPGTYKGPELPTDPIMLWRYLDACRAAYARSLQPGVMGTESAGTA